VTGHSEVTGSRELLTNYDPKNGAVLGHHPIANEEDMHRAFTSGSRAFEQWRSLPLGARRRLLRRIRERIVERIPTLVDAICADTGKVRMEALMADIYPTLEMIRYYEEHLVSILRPRRRKAVMGFSSICWVEYFPRGVVVVISPWNYPFQLAMIPVITAIAAGNAVVLKPSEITPLVGQEIARLFSGLDSMPPDLVTVLQGDGRVGRRLVEAGPDMVFFTGSVATGKKVMASAAETLTPVMLELGGKDPFIVLEDADLERAAAGAVYAAFANAGQLCMSAERVYVHRSIADDFVERVRRETERLRVNQGDDGDMGPLTHPDQRTHVVEQITDAIERGARVISGDRDIGSEGDRVGSSLAPHILCDVDHSMDLMREETFGPVMPIMTFSDDEEAVRLANDSPYGLNASVWSRDRNRARRLASRLEVGSCAINDAVKHVGIPSLPFGGVKDSGMGRYHGPEGLVNFSHTRAVAMHRRTRGREINWFPFNRDVYEDLMAYLGVRFGAGSRLRRLLKAPALLGRVFRRVNR